MAASIATRAKQPRSPNSPRADGVGGRIFFAFSLSFVAPRDIYFSRFGTAPDPAALQRWGWTLQLVLTEACAPSERKVGPGQFPK
eukprot:scaffold24520_cov101-Isochrysis_galbana.AAC.1